MYSLSCCEHPNLLSNAKFPSASSSLQICNRVCCPLKVRSIFFSTFFWFHLFPHDGHGEINCIVQAHCYACILLSINHNTEIIQSCWTFQSSLRAFISYLDTKILTLIHACMYSVQSRCVTQTHRCYYWFTNLSIELVCILSPIAGFAKSFSNDSAEFANTII